MNTVLMRYHCPTYYSLAADAIRKTIKKVMTCRKTTINLKRLGFCGQVPGRSTGHPVPSPVWIELRRTQPSTAGFTIDFSLTPRCTQLLRVGRVIPQYRYHWHSVSSRVQLHLLANRYSVRGSSEARANSSSSHVQALKPPCLREAVGGVGAYSRLCGSALFFKEIVALYLQISSPYHPTLALNRERLGEQPRQQPSQKAANIIAVCSTALV